VRKRIDLIQPRATNVGTAAVHWVANTHYRYFRILPAAWLADSTCLDTTEMQDFVKRLGKNMKLVKSGLKENRETMFGTHTPYCVSSTENKLIPLLVGLVSAGADAGGKQDGQLDLGEFKTLMSFLKVVMCKGNPKLAKLSGVSGPLMTTAAWVVVLEKTWKAMSNENKEFGERSNESSVEGSDEDSDDSDEDDGECLLPRLR